MFEFDLAKSAANKEKHGIDFGEAQLLWNDAKRIEVAARLAGEERFLVVGVIGEKHWTAIITYRGECIRIISVRRSRNDEVGAYEAAHDD